MKMMLLIPLCLGLTACDKDNFVARWIMDGQRPVVEETEPAAIESPPEDSIEKKIVGTWGDTWYCQTGRVISFDSKGHFKGRFKDEDGVESSSIYFRDDGIWTADGGYITIILDPTETDGSDGTSTVIEATARVIDGRLILDYYKEGTKTVYYNCARNWW